MKYATWLMTAAVFQFLTAIVHAIGLFMSPQRTNETEKQMVELMTTYKMDLGAGFLRSMSDLFTALSSCFSLVYLLGGMINWYLMRKNVGANVMKGVININLAIFGASFVLMTVFTFLPPITLTGLVLIFLVAARVTVR